MGTISQGGNQMAQVSRDFSLWPFVWAAVIFHLFPILLLTACWVKPEGITPPCTLFLLQTQKIKLQLAPQRVTPSPVPSHSSSTFQCPQTLIPSWSPQSVEWSCPTFTEKQSFNMTKQNFPFILVCLLVSIPFSKEERLLFFSKSSPLFVLLPGTLLHQLSTFSSSVPCSLLLFLTPLLLPRKMPQFPLN